MLVLSELRAEDAGEVRFQAGPAQSTAELEVEGKPLPRGRPGAGSTFAGAGKLAACPRDAASPTSLISRGSPGAGHRGQREEEALGGGYRGMGPCH